MLFKRRYLEGLADGTITLAFRRWKRPRVGLGSLLRTPVGVLEVESIQEIPLSRITKAEALIAGYASRAELLRELRRLAERIVAVAGLEVVELSLRGSSRRRVLRLDIDRVGPAGVGLEDCRRITHELSEDLEQSELLSSGYVLEVSSPGIDRPMRSVDDFRRNVGRRVIVTTVEPVQGRISFRGMLLGSDGDCLELAEDGESVVRIPLDRIEKARQDVAF